nr:protein ECERIFERUM 26-like [Ipomoea batatas]
MGVLQSRIVFDFLKENVRSGVDKKTDWFKKIHRFGFVIGELLKSEGVTFREGSAGYRTHFHMKSKPPSYDKRKASAMGVQVSTPPKKKLKASVAKGEPSTLAAKGASTSKAPEAMTKKAAPKATKKAPAKAQAETLKKPSKKASKNKAPILPIVQVPIVEQVVIPSTILDDVPTEETVDEVPPHPDEIDQVYQDKLAGKETRKGKGRAIDDDVPTPTDLAKSDRRLIERVQRFSRFQVRFVDHNPEVCTSNSANQAEGSGDNTTRADDDAKTEGVDTTSVAEAESYSDQAEPSNDQPENTPVEDATPDADDSTEPSSSNDSGDKVNNQCQMVIYQGVVDSTPLTREDDEPSIPVEINDTPHSPTPNVEVPRNDLQMVVLGNQIPPSPREDETPRTEDKLNPTLVAQVDPSLEVEINLGPSLSLARGDNSNVLPGASYDEFEPSTDDHSWMPHSNPRSMSDTTSIHLGLQIMAKDNRMLKALTNVEKMMDYLMEGITNLHLGQENIQKQQHSMEHNYFGLKKKMMPKRGMIEGEETEADTDEVIEIKATEEIEAIQADPNKHGKSTSEQRMTKTVDGRFVPYVPYVEESEERFDGNKVPPNLMKKDNKKNEREDGHNGIIKKRDEDHIKFNAVFQIITENKQRHIEGMNTTARKRLTVGRSCYYSHDSIVESNLVELARLLKHETADERRKIDEAMEKEPGDADVRYRGCETPTDTNGEDKSHAYDNRRASDRVTVAIDDQDNDHRPDLI